MKPLRACVGAGIFVLVAGMATAESPAALSLAVGQNFIGSVYGVDSYYVPADANGVIGPQHFVELINGRFSVYDKTSGVRVQTMSDTAFWTSAGVTFPTGVGATDPRLVYDRSSQRWFAAALDLGTSSSYVNRFLLAVSASADPRGSWQAVAFKVDPGNGAQGDFTALGVDANGVYLAASLFSIPAGNYVGVTVVSFPKSNLLASPPVFTARTAFGPLSSGVRGFVPQPVVSFDPPAGAAPVLAVGDTGVDFNPHSNLVFFAVQNAAGPGSASLTSSASISVPAYNVPLNPPQPSGLNNLDDGDARFGATVWRAGPILYAVHNIQVGDRAALRWYTISATNQALLQSGTITHPSLDLFYPSIAANSNGTVIIAFNGCSLQTFISSFAVLGETVDGTTQFGDPVLLASGTASYSDPLALPGDTWRWGDYSATTVDPADPTRFWTIQLVPVGSQQWATQITELLVSPLRLEATLAGASLRLSWPATATGFSLVGTTNFLRTNLWTAVAQTLTTNSGRVSVSVPTVGPPTCFRLQKF